MLIKVPITIIEIAKAVPAKILPKLATKAKPTEGQDHQ